jgi:hypothetical protein
MRSLDRRNENSLFIFCDGASCWTVTFLEYRIGWLLICVMNGRPCRNSCTSSGFIGAFVGFSSRWKRAEDVLQENSHDDEPSMGVS